MASFRDIGPLQSGAGLDLGPLQSSGTVSLTLSVSDSYTISDTASFSLGLLLPIFNDSTIFYDTIQFVDAPSLAFLGDTLQWNWFDSVVLGFAAVNFILSDSYTISDAAIVGGVQPSFLFTDSYAISDGIQLNLNLPYTLNDSFTINDSIIIQNLFVVNEFFADFINIQDSISIQLNTLLSVTSSDSYTINDVLLLVISLPLRFGDIIPPYADFIQKGGINSSSVFVGDFLLWSDALRLGLSYRYLFSDSEVLTDSFLYSLSSSGNAFSDSYTLNDSITLSLSQPLTVVVSDVYTLNDSVVEQLPEPLNTYIRRYLNDVVM